MTPPNNPEELRPCQLCGTFTSTHKEPCVYWYQSEVSRLKARVEELEREKAAYREVAIKLSRIQMGGGLFSDEEKESYKAKLIDMEAQKLLEKRGME